MKYKVMYKQLFHITKLAGIVTKYLQSGIQNEGKQVDDRAEEDAYHKAMRQAKTKVDVMVQEMFLQQLYPMYGEDLSLDVEEDSESVQRYHNTSYEYTLVLDPIDGTLDYIQQMDTYSICCAILHQQDVKVAIVYFPARDELYGYYEGAPTMYYKGLTALTYEQGTALDFEQKQPKPSCIYINSRVASYLLQTLEEKGYSIIDESYQRLGCPDAILKCMKGEALAYYADTSNVRDILLGVILSKMKHGYCFQFDGSNVAWVKKGRQKDVIFSIYTYLDIMQGVKV